MFIRAHEAGYMYVATLSERDLPVLASERCPYKLFSQGWAKHQKDMAVLFFRLFLNLSPFSSMKST